MTVTEQIHGTAKIQYTNASADYIWLDSDEVTGWEIIGAVPGTPAAEQGA